MLLMLEKLGVIYGFGNRLNFQMFHDSQISNKNYCFSSLSQLEKQGKHFEVQNVALDFLPRMECSQILQGRSRGPGKGHEFWDQTTCTEIHLLFE